MYAENLCAADKSKARTCNLEKGKQHLNFNCPMNAPLALIKQSLNAALKWRWCMESVRQQLSLSAPRHVLWRLLCSLHDWLRSLQCCTRRYMCTATAVVHDYTRKHELTEWNNASITQTNQFSHGIKEAGSSIRVSALWLIPHLIFYSTV